MIGGSDVDVLQRNPVKIVRCEPSQQTMQLDFRTRILIDMVRVAGIGAATPTATLKLKRENSATVFSHAIGNVNTPDSVVPIIRDNVIPSDFATTLAGAALIDKLQIDVEIDPGEAAAHVVAVDIKFIPTLRGNQSGTGRGNIFSGPAHY